VREKMTPKELNNNGERPSLLLLGFEVHYRP